MTEKEILEYNKMCAEFLGADKVDMKNGLDYYQHEFFTREVWSTQCQGYVEEDIICSIYLQFHCDWNWIHEIIEAIEKLYKHPNKQICINIKGGEIEIFQMPYYLESNYYHEVIYLGDGYINNSKQEAVVEAINQFLIWYNNK